LSPGLILQPPDHASFPEPFTGQLPDAEARQGGKRSFRSAPCAPLLSTGSALQALLPHPPSPGKRPWLRPSLPGKPALTRQPGGRTPQTPATAPACGMSLPLRLPRHACATAAVADVAEVAHGVGGQVTRVPSGELSLGPAPAPLARAAACPARTEAGGRQHPPEPSAFPSRPGLVASREGQPSARRPVPPRRLRACPLAGRGGEARGLGNGCGRGKGSGLPRGDPAGGTWCSNVGPSPLARVRS